MPDICSGKELITEKQIITYHDTFKGESENWKAKYVLNETHVFTTTDHKTHYYGEDRDWLAITYKGNLSEFSSPKHINLSYDAGYRGSRRVDHFTQEEYVFRSYSGGYSIKEKRAFFGHTIFPVSIKEQKPIFGHTIGLVCAPYNTVYIHHEASGGTKISKNDTIKVTVELGGEVENMELKSANDSSILKNSSV
ncbi:hypothetical protein EO95_15315 [Methanosarcina sp. 1.H.T.1A.1]|uniref:hypothetical protein n=1 Tax=Methanosarcina sp. 1.H.T.1A.1 TaxID=1483602 RepID=UPI000621E2F7|nr:hypothetical protein [Methanosarcina sp. 1.H.T.1A.1]KKH93402.1 hypothetical protein EO95_15315 [Methanosarcina sp. 1.H.T.1A.1]